MSTLEFETSIQPAQGFHFSITTKLSPDIPPECTAVNLRFTLPPSVFADPYELDLHRSAFSYHISALPDLELPTSAVDQADIVLDVNAAISSPPIVTVPVHARYGEAKDTGEDMFESIHIKYPKVTLLCQSKGHEAITLTQRPAVDSLVIRVPSGLKSDVQVVEVGTFLVIFTAFLYLSFVVLKTTRRLELGYHRKAE